MRLTWKALRNRTNWRADRPAADPAHPEAARAATNTTTETPPKKKPKTANWIALASVAIALASAVAATIAAISAHNQVNAANQQNIVAEQQQLVAQTTTIVQDLNQSTSNGQIMTSELTLEGQSAEMVITELHGIGVTGVEYYDVAQALAIGEGYTTDAIPYYHKAVNTPPYDAGTQAEALRGEAILYYNLGEPDTGHEYFMRAVNVYNGHVEMVQFAKDNNIAQSYLLDAQNQLNISGCAIASTDINEAEKFLHQAGGKNDTNAPLLTNDQTAYSKGCPQGDGTSATPAG